MSGATLKNLPFYLSIGPQRAGTSWLDRYLRARCDVCLPSDVKEIFFFDRHFEKGQDFYESHFNPQPVHKIAMEFTTTSFDDPEAPQRIVDLYGTDIKMICPLRNPIPRSFSLFRHYKRYGIVKGNLQEACEENPQILTSSHYSEHLKRWYSIFPTENIKVVFQEDLDQNQDKYVKDVCSFLGIPYIEIPAELREKYNATAKPRSARMASLAQSSADFLRNRGIYGPVNIAKKLGLKKLVFGAEGERADALRMTDEERQFLAEKLGSERDHLTALMLKNYKAK